MDLILPYKIGDLAESRSFVKGYRGAWFRCKINDMRVTESGHFECYLEYTEYPGEKKEWIRLFQKNLTSSKQRSSDQIMIRPSFPQWHREDKVPEQLPNNDVIAIVHETWKVGDKVDWCSEGCYWSGIITMFVKSDVVTVKLLRPPVGEGQCYDANINDLRPTLDWSLEGGWTVPLSQEKGKSWHVVRLIHYISAESETSDSEEETSSDDGDKGENGGDIQDVQLHMISSNTSPGSSIMKPSSAAKSMSSLNAQKDDTLSQSGIGIIKQRRGMGSSIKQDQAVQDQYLQKLAEGDGSLKELLAATLLMERRAALLCSFFWSNSCLL
ncbi:hypothetical protein QOZ80_5BG0453720 [Eleusine coracana subsp. coracana]|nr:hypothetical protein QOZ80_5BG0453720 [Eleusine coracana subsp. coracana]